MTKRFSALALTALLALPLLAGCGSSTRLVVERHPPAASSTTAGSGGEAEESGAETIKTTSNDLGTILVDGEGKTLYLFEGDTGSKSMCSGGCAGAWPPVTTEGDPQAGSGVTASMLGTTKRDDGATQVTYGGHPLYYYYGDTSPRPTTGQGLDDYDAEWYVLGADGKKVEGGEADEDESSQSGKRQRRQVLSCRASAHARGRRRRAAPSREPAHASHTACMFE